MQPRKICLVIEEMFRLFYLCLLSVLVLFLLRFYPAIQQTMSADFIGAEKLEEEIEKLLDSRSDYNFAITKTGDILPGEYPTRPQDQSQHTKKTV